ncbi:cyclase family protein [Paenibacillus sp. NPDC057934]|uniref:cyclase family protein n=1 Tax=Paenibacillus sp. NPDC057934 TaxID=3346282 RepID=UPI0036DB2B07
MLIELTHLIFDGLPVYPGDTATHLVHSKQFLRDKYNNHQLDINMHSGTHIDGPMHMLDVTKTINEYPLDTFIGNGCMLDVSNETVIDYSEACENKIQERDIVLLHTGHDVYFGQERYFEGHPVLSMEFARLLVKKRVKIIGMDMPSPDRFPFEIHKYLLSNDVLILENLTNVGALLG